MIIVNPIAAIRQLRDRAAKTASRYFGQTRHDDDRLSEAPDTQNSGARVARIRLLIDEAYYRRRYGKLLGDLSPVQHYLRYGGAQKFNPHPLFDSAFYQAQVSGALPPDLTTLEHYLDHGAAAGLAPSPLFDAKAYNDLHTDVARAGVNALFHYIRWGAREGRKLPTAWPDLEVRLEQTLSQDPLHPIALQILSQVRLDQGRIADALNALKALETVQEPNAESAETNRKIRQAAAELFYRNGMVERSLEIYREILQLQPDDMAARTQVGFLLRDIGDLEGAERELAVVRAANGASDLVIRAESRLRDERLNFQSLIDSSESAEARGDYDESAALLSEAEVIRPISPARFNKARPRSTANSTDLLLLDTSFPSKLSSFRYGEFDAYLQEFPLSRIYSSVWHLSGLQRDIDFAQISKKYSSESSVQIDRIQNYHKDRSFDCQLAYCVFLNNANLFFSENARLAAHSMMFTLYPGGGFELNNPASDAKLRRLLDNKRLSRVITTQNVSHRYLVDNGFCEPDRILHIFGGIIPACITKGGLVEVQRVRPPCGRELKVCFVAHRYSETGIEKGYDVFVDLVRAFRNREDIEFHVVGGFSPDTLDLGGATNIIFHGIKNSEFFPDFYRSMDIIVSPNISASRLNGGIGSFDGFPTTACVEAGLHGVAMFISDFEGMNLDLSGRNIFAPGSEIELIDRNLDRLVCLIDAYARDRDKLSGLASRGKQALLREFSYERQIAPRIALLSSGLR